jgi:hypothetical protein
MRRAAAPVAPLAIVAFGLVVAAARDARAAEPGGRETAGAPVLLAREPSKAPAPKDSDAGTTAAPASDATAEKTIVVWPTLTPAGDDANPLPLHRPTTSEPLLLARAQELDATFRDAVQDLGYVLDVADEGPAVGRARDEDLLRRAARGGKDQGTFVVSARLEPAGGSTFVLRIVVVPPKSKELRVRVETVKGDDVSVRGLVMLRDLIEPGAIPTAPTVDEKRLGCADVGDVNTTGLRSPGRAVLAVNGGVFGGYVAYSLQRASGSDDPRVLYPLLALGTGIGVGSALLVSDEWDLSTGDAWFLSAGAWWGAGAGVLVANGREVPLTDRFAYGVGSGLGGLALATFALTRSRMDDGDAVLVHSGGALGLFVGGLAELAYRGTTSDVTPYTGAGYGAAVGVVGAGALALVVSPSPSRVLLVDLGAALGGLAGASAASPLVFQDVTESKNRLFLAATLGGTVAGGAVAWLLTRNDTGARSGFLLPGVPTAGVIGSTPTPTGTVPAYGLGWRGTF